MARIEAITVAATGSEIEVQPKTIVRSKPEAIVSTQNAYAVEIEELEIAYDDDLRSAIIQRLVRDRDSIISAANQERQVSLALESARLAAVENAREQGKQQARADAAAKKKEALAKSQRRFIDIDLPKLLDSCEHLGYETMKLTIDAFASGMKIKISWTELDNGQFECTASVT